MTRMSGAEASWRAWLWTRRGQDVDKTWTRRVLFPFVYVVTHERFGQEPVNEKTTIGCRFSMRRVAHCVF